MDARLAILEASGADSRMAVIPTWVRQQLEDAASLLAERPKRAKLEFHRLGISFTITPAHEDGGRPFLRAVGARDFEHLAFSSLEPPPPRSD